jgi:hypothetical protein
MPVKGNHEDPNVWCTGCCCWRLLSQPADKVSADAILGDWITERQRVKVEIVLLDVYSGE